LIVVVSYRGDKHADLVESALGEARFEDVLRIDLERSLRESELAIECGDEWCVASPFSGRRATAGTVKTVWWRRSALVGAAEVQSPTERIDQEECYWAARWLLESLSERLFPFGHPYRLRSAENKILQLRTAQRSGLRIPRTCISNDKRKLAAFAGSLDSVVVKPLSVSTVTSQEGASFVVAAPVRGAQLVELVQREPRESFLFCQERIEKTSDVRVFWFPDGTHFSCEIDTRGLPPDEVDWRLKTMTWPHREIAMPEPVAVAAKHFLATMGLTSGSFDFAMTPQGEWIFLECNPNGQWLWMELKTGVELARRVASLLLEHHGDSLATNSD
jgi:hypothetical protein